MSVPTEAPVDVGFSDVSKKEMVKKKWNQIKKVNKKFIRYTMCLIKPSS